MPSDDATELRNLATQARKKQAAATKRTRDEEAAVKLLAQQQLRKAQLLARAARQQDREVEKLLTICLSAAKNCMTSIQTPLIPDDIGKRLVSFGLTTATTPSKEATRLALLVKEAEVRKRDFTTQIIKFQNRISDSLASCGHNADSVRRLTRVAASLEPQNFEINFPPFFQLLMEQADQYLSESKAKKLRADGIVRDTQTELDACIEEIDAIQRRLLNANRPISPAGKGLLQQLMASGPPSIGFEPNVEFQKYFALTVELALKGGAEDEVKKRWLSMRTALRTQNIGYELEQIAVFRRHVEHEIQDYSRRYDLTPSIKSKLEMRQLDLEGNLWPKLEADLATVTQAQRAMTEQHDAAKMSVANFKTIPISMRKGAEVFHDFISSNSSEVESLQTFPATVTRITWTAPTRPVIEQRSHVPQFADLLRFLSGPEWNAMYSRLFAIAKQAASAGATSCSIDCEESDDGYLRLTLGSKAHPMPAMPLEEFCKILAERSNMQCSAVPARKNQQVQVKLTW